IKFKKDGGIMDLLQKIANLNIAEMDIEMARLEVTNNGKFAADRQNDLLQNPKTAFLAFQLLHNAEEEQLISKWTDEQIATAAISHYEAIDSKKDSLEFIEKRIVNAGGKSATFYFYTVTKNADADYNPYGMPNKILTGIAFVNNKDRIDPQ